MQEHDYETMQHCVRAYLGHVREAMGEIERIEGEMAHQQASLALMGISYGAGGSGANVDKIPDGVAKAMELREKWSEAYARLADDIEHARELCCSKATPSRWAAWLREVERMSWQQIGSKLGYSTRHLHRMEVAGIVAIYYAMPEQWRRDPIPNAAPI